MTAAALWPQDDALLLGLGWRRLLPNTKHHPRLRGGAFHGGSDPERDPLHFASGVHGAAKPGQTVLPNAISLSPSPSPSPSPSLSLSLSLPLAPSLSLSLALALSLSVSLSLCLSLSLCVFHQARGRTPIAGRPSVDGPHGITCVRLGYHSTFVFP